MPYLRPPSVPFPHTWHQFTARGQALRIQDLTEDLFTPALDLLTAYFTRDEPPCKYIGINDHPKALASLQELWWSTVKAKVSLVCLAEDNQVVAVNVLTVSCQGDHEEPFQTDDAVWGKLFGAVELVGKSVDVFQRFGVEEYLTAYGLVVHPEWRGLGIGQLMLEARIPLCRALNVKVTATVFTAAASQAVAQKAGFHVLYEITYEELAKKGFRFPGVEKDTKSSKLMALVIN